MPIRAAIFDMGNTLLHYTPLDWSWRQAEEPGIDGIYWEVVSRGFIQNVDRVVFVDRFFALLQRGWLSAVAGDGNLRLEDWIVEGLATFRVPPTVAPMEELIAAYVALRRRGLGARPQAAETLATLRDQGYRMGLISNTAWPGNIHRADLDNLGLLPYLEHCTFSGDAGVWKPNPAIFERTAAALDTAPAETVVVGDSPREDIRGAQAAGMRAVWVYTPEFALDGVQPDAKVAQLGELLPLLEKWNQ